MSEKIDFRYVTKDESRDFHSRRRAFVILDNKLRFIPKGSTMSHFEFCQNEFPTLSRDDFNKITRGYFLDGDLVFYKDNFIYDNDVINEALAFVKEIKNILSLETAKIYFGLIVGSPGEDWPKDYYFGDLLPDGKIIKNKRR